MTPGTLKVSQLFPPLEYPIQQFCGRTSCKASKRRKPRERLPTAPALHIIIKRDCFCWWDIYIIIYINRYLNCNAKYEMLELLELLPNLTSPVNVFPSVTFISVITLGICSI